MRRASLRYVAGGLLLLMSGMTLRAQSVEFPLLSQQQVHDLHGTVINEQYELRGDPAAARLLSRMYAAGKAVPSDDIVACALALKAQFAAQMPKRRAGEDLYTYDRLLAEADAFRTTMCGGLSAEQQTLAANAVACPAFGMPEDIVQLDTVPVRIGRGGIGVLDAPPEKIYGLPNCPVLVNGARIVTALPPPPPAAASRGRQFVEVLYWLRGGNDGRSFDLYLLLLELRNDRFEAAAMELLKDSTAWPDPVDIRTWYEMRHDGRIRFEVDGDVRKRGWIG